ncbi:MAG: hypothetical protein N2V77_02255 [Canidatus Methanoxibalbensis ujae]|nr:hypothetical protein [Candidatus Methanoxibalbensis ujae]
MESALKDKPGPGQPKNEIKHETEIAALACTAPPEGRKNGHWSFFKKNREREKVLKQ